VRGAAARGALLDRDHHAVGNGDPNVARPARGQQGVIEEKLASQIAVSAAPASRLDNRSPCANMYRELAGLRAG
jgi:hypothetical protein